MKKITLELTDDEYGYFIDIITDLNSNSYEEFELLNTSENYDFLEKVINLIFKEDVYSRKNYIAKLNKQFKKREPLMVWAWFIQEYFSHLIRDSTDHCSQESQGRIPDIPDQVLTRLMLAESLADGVVEFINSPVTLFPAWELLCDPLDAFRPGWNESPAKKEEECGVSHQNEDSPFDIQLELAKIKAVLSKIESRITSDGKLSKFCANCHGTGCADLYPGQRPCRKCNSNGRT